MTTLPISVTHDAGHSRFIATVDGVPCVLDYQLQDGIMSIVHTGVPSEVGGRGIAAELTRHALETARAQGGAYARCAPTRRCTYGVTPNTTTCWPERPYSRDPQSRRRHATLSLRKRQALRRMLRPLACRPAVPAGARRRGPDALALQRLRAGSTGLSARDLASRHAPRSAGAQPADLKWLGLTIKRAQAQDADHATVEFVARSRQAGRAHRMHELSRFVREQGQWFYVDGDVD